MSATANASLTFLQQPSRVQPALATRVIGTLGLWRRRIRWRQELLRLSYRDIQDMGVTPADVDWEASQPFWREAPPR